MNYLDAGLITAVKRTPAPFFYSASGYGSKIPGERMIQLKGSNRWYRIYAICWSNVASYFIVKSKQHIFIGPESENRIDDLLQRSVICPQCNKEVWDIAKGSKLNKCWNCMFAFD